MPRTCSSCHSTQGPFARTFVGFRRTGKYIFTCKPDERGDTPAKRLAPIQACQARRLKLIEEGLFTSTP